MYPLNIGANGLIHWITRETSPINEGTDRPITTQSGRRKDQGVDALRSCPITFDFGNGVGIETPHVDAMVIMAVINNYRVERVLINDGSFVNLLPYHVLKRMGI